MTEPLEATSVSRFTRLAKNNLTPYRNPLFATSRIDLIDANPRNRYLFANAILDSGGVLKIFRRTPWRFQQTVQKPLKDLFSEASFEPHGLNDLLAGSRHPNQGDKRLSLGGDQIPAIKPLLNGIVREELTVTLSDIKF